MISFFKNIFQPSNQKKSSKDKNDDLTRIYFDRFKKNYLEIKMPKDFSCQDIHSHYHNEILAELMKNNTPNNSSNSFSKIINANEFAFMILDDSNPYTEIKLKMKDLPSKYFKRQSINLFYLNISPTKKEESGMEFRMQEQEGYSINPVNQGSINSIQMSAGECIREGELMKYSFKHKKFDKRIVVLDKEKLIITKPKNKESTILLLSDISSINRELSDKSARDKYTFEITTYEADHYIFKSKHNADLESWIESIYNFLSLIRDNKFIIKYGEQINKLVKDSYEKGMKIIYNCLSLKGLVSIKETRDLLFKMYGDKQICTLLEAVINYKHNIRYYKYLEAWRNFEEIFEILEIDNFDLNSYYLPSNTINYNNNMLPLSIDDDIVLNPIQRKISTESFNNELLEEIKNLGGRSNSKISTQQNYLSTTRKSSIPDNIKERKVLLENSNKTPSSRERESIMRKTSITEAKQLDVDEEKTEGIINIENKKIQIAEISEISKTRRSSNTIIKLENNNIEQNLSNFNPNISTAVNNRNKILLVKQLLSFENLKYLKNLKLDIKEIIEKNKSEGSTNDTKLYESLKPNIFNEIFDNILTKHLQNFYKTINTNPTFTSRIENILLYFYKTKNKINYSSMIDLENNFHSTLNQPKITISMPEIKTPSTDHNVVVSNNQIIISEDKK